MAPAASSRLSLQDPRDLTIEGTLPYLSYRFIWDNWCSARPGLEACLTNDITWIKVDLFRKSY